MEKADNILNENISNNVNLDNKKYGTSSDYSIIKAIGSGNYGQVYLAYNKKEKKEYAIKKINFNSINSKERENIENEIKLLEELRHPNIIYYKETFLDDKNNLNIVMAYCDGGDMYSMIRKNKGKMISEEVIVNYIVQIGLAMSYIHSQKILHRDLKTENIFLQNNLIRIGDFGIAKEYHQTKAPSDHMEGTPLYMSPELYSGKKYGFKSDIWSFGCCIYELCNQKNAFEGESWNGVALKVMKGTFAPINTFYSKDLRSIIESMLEVKANKRPTINYLLEKPFLKYKVADYIINTIKSSIDKNSDITETQVEILKMQALKLGILEYIEQQLNPDNDNNSINKNEVDTMNKDIFNININSNAASNLYSDNRNLNDFIVGNNKSSSNTNNTNQNNDFNVKTTYNKIDNNLNYETFTNINKSLEDEYFSNKVNNNFNNIYSSNKLTENDNYVKEKAIKFSNINVKDSNSNNNINYTNNKISVNAKINNKINFQSISKSKSSLNKLNPLNKIT